MCVFALRDHSLTWSLGDMGQGWVGATLCPPGAALDLRLWHHIRASTAITQQHSCGNLGQDKMSRNTQIQSQLHYSVHIHVQKTRGRGEGSGVETGSLPGGALYYRVMN